MNRGFSVLGLIALSSTVWLPQEPARAQQSTSSLDLQIWTDTWGMQLAAAYSPSRAGPFASSDTHLGLTTVDPDLEWDMLASLNPLGHNLVPYTLVGVGCAWTSLDKAMHGIVGSVPVRVTDGNSSTAKAGLGLQYYLTDQGLVALDGRYRYISRLVSDYGQGSNTSAVTLSAGCRF
jgi:opacity protein-like surface antigen